jgi:excisionase family DNA binding protein
MPPTFFHQETSMDLAPPPGRARKSLAPPKLPDTLSVHEAALRLRMTDAAVARLLRLGTLDARSFKMGRDWRILTADVDRLAAEIDALMAIEDGVEPVI